MFEGLFDIVRYGYFRYGKTLHHGVNDFGQRRAAVARFPNQTRSRVELMNLFLVSISSSISPATLFSLRAELRRKHMSKGNSIEGSSGMTCDSIVGTSVHSIMSRIICVVLRKCRSFRRKKPMRVNQSTLGKMSCFRSQSTLNRRPKSTPIRGS